MKQTKFLYLFFAIAIIGLISNACKKDSTAETFDSSSLEQLSKDQAAMESNINDAFSDANDVLSYNGTKSILSGPCNATVDTLLMGDTVKYTITFNGNNCANTKTKSGKIIIKRKLTIPWTQANSWVSVTFDSLKIGKSSNTTDWILFNGDLQWQNVSGGKINDLNSFNDSVVYRISGSVLATFNDNTSRTWNLKRQLQYSGVYPNNMQITVTGFGTSGSYTNLITWGVNRQNEAFYTSITQAVVLKQSCNWDPVSGVQVHQIPSLNKTATTTFGYDNANLPVTGTNCPTKFKLDWQHGTLSGSVFLFL
ncbi:MAG: hypothetical protein NTZ33_02220 [Bacteroidetes bacterium]|nr:hypothetical protein [Bacteroidota bacterium]